jgi:hypothetical protein
MELLFYRGYFLLAFSFIDQIYASKIDEMARLFVLLFISP